jgi:hypothetical protein
MDNKSCKNEKSRYYCNTCDYYTSRKSSYDKHLLTASHNTKVKSCNNIEKVATDNFECGCGKVYKYKSGLCKHKHICSNKKTTSTENYTDPESSIPFIMNIMNENKEFKEFLIEQSKFQQKILEQSEINKSQNDIQNQKMLELQKENNELMNKMVEITQNQVIINPQSNINSNNITNNNNQIFNLNLFLNETCKDAMNIQEFIENVKITFEELLAIGNSGFVNGISDIFIKQLRDLEINKRPIHCTDSKRETIYLKEQDSWNKDDKDKTRLKQIIEKIEYKNVAALHNWCNENPDAKVNNTANNVLKDKIFYQTLQGDERTRDKIIKNISKEVTIEKQCTLLEN